MSSKVLREPRQDATSRMAKYVMHGARVSDERRGRKRKGGRRMPAQLASRTRRTTEVEGDEKFEEKETKYEAQWRPRRGIRVRRVLTARRVERRGVVSRASRGARSPLTRKRTTRLEARTKCTTRLEAASESKARASNSRASRDVRPALRERSAHLDLPTIPTEVSRHQKNCLPPLGSHPHPSQRRAASSSARAVRRISARTSNERVSLFFLLVCFEFCARRATAMRTCAKRAQGTHFAGRLELRRRERRPRRAPHFAVIGTRERPARFESF